MADNMVTLVGSLGSDPELRMTPNGADVVNFSIATNERVRNAEGKWVDGATSWFRITVWGTLGRNAHASLRKGQRVVVHGPLRITEYSTGSNGTSKSAEVKAVALGHDLTFGTSTFARNAAQAQHQPTQQTQQPATEPRTETPAGTSPDTPAGTPTEIRVPETVQVGWGAQLAHDDETPF